MWRLDKGAAAAKLSRQLLLQLTQLPECQETNSLVFQFKATEFKKQSEKSENSTSKN